LENVRAALSEGEFFIDDAAGSLYVWPKPSWKRASDGKFVAVTPVDNSVIELRGTEFVTLSNLSIRDSSYVASGIWKNPVRAKVLSVSSSRQCTACCPQGPHDAALVVRGSHHVSIEACSFGTGVAGYGVGATDGSRGLRVVGCHVEGVGQGGVLLYGNLTNHSQPTGAKISHNVIRSSGTILKFVSGIGLHYASWSLVSHNRVEDMPRFGISVSRQR
jgi:hypothetical protein